MTTTHKSGMDAAAREHIRRYYDGTLRPDEMVAAMSQEVGWFPSRRVRRGVTVSPLPDADHRLPPLGSTITAGRSISTIICRSIASPG